MAKKSITGGASFQSILLQSDSTQIENIGIAIYQMHRYYSGKIVIPYDSYIRFQPELTPFLVSGVVKDHVIEYFLNNIIGNKDKLKVRIRVHHLTLVLPYLHKCHYITRTKH